MNELCYLQIALVDKDNNHMPLLYRGLLKKNPDNVFEGPKGSSDTEGVYRKGEYCRD